MSLALRQTGALFLDAYRELNARKLFWITTALTVLVVLAFAGIRLTESGFGYLVWVWDNPTLNSTFIPEDQFFLGLFIQFGVKFWLAWLVTILSLIATAGIFPDLISGGVIDTMLSKPLGRVRLFFTKYVTGLLFSLLQVLLFCIGAFLLLGLKAGSWQLGIFIAVPLVVSVYSFLFSICVVLGLLTRSTIASLLLTLLMWFGIWFLNTADTTLLGFRVASELTVEQQQEVVDNLGPNADREAPEQELADAQGTERTIARFHNAVLVVKTLLPKTQETTALLDRVLLSGEVAERAAENRERPDMQGAPSLMANMQTAEAENRIRERATERPLWWVLGTSFAFEAVVLLLGCWIFSRRDF